MDWQGWFVLALALSALLLMSFGRAGPHWVMLGVMVNLSASELLTPQEALAGFSNAGLMTVVALFIVASGIHHSGGVDLLVKYLLRQPKTVRGAQARITLPVALLSGFLNNTPVVATMIPAVHAVSLMTELITNNAAAVVMLPIILSITQAANLPPKPYILAVMMAASASFATPLGYQTNLMVFGPGNYRFSDFLKVGIPMNIYIGAVTILVIWLKYF